MKRILMHFSSGTYPIFIGKGILRTATRLFNLNAYYKKAIITDANVKKIFAKTILNYFPNSISIITIPSGEKAKSIKYVSEIWEEMLRLGCDRKSLVINFGGGAVLDTGTFAASTYMRGIDFLNVPTTLLSQVDASVGGKTGINFAGIKNLIGTFNQPKAVVIDVQTLATLPKREFLSGFAEIIKHGLIKDKKYFDKVTSKYPLRFSQDELIDIINRSCEIKTKIVESDEREKGARKLLNFGHTIGHAIEALGLKTSTPLLHGEAISIGMMAEAKISSSVGLLPVSDLKRIRQALINANLPITTSEIETDKVLEKIKKDKKNEKGKVNFTLLKGIGEAVYNQNVSDEVVNQALGYYSSSEGAASDAATESRSPKR